jgi:hypothetical protein
VNRNLIEEVKSPPPNWFPIVVFTQDSAEVILFGDLTNYVSKHPDYTFLAPTSQESSLEKRLAESLQKKGEDIYPKIKVNHISLGRQSLEIKLSGDVETVVQYEATSKEIYPISIKRIGPLLPLIVLFISILIGTVSCGLGYGLLRIYKNANKSLS